jgi:hypothetical protein
MDSQETLSSFGREYGQFDLAALYEIDHLAWITGGVDVDVPRDRDRASVTRLVRQGIAQLFFELVDLGSAESSLWLLSITMLRDINNSAAALKSAPPNVSDLVVD